MSYQQRLGRRTLPRTQQAAARRIAAGETGASARRDAAIIARSAIPRPMPMGTRRFMANRGSNREVNFLDNVLATGVTISTTVSVATGTIALLNGMAQGTTASTRIGRKICIKSVQVQGTIEAGSTICLARTKVCLVYDKQSNGVAPSWQDVFDNSTALGANSPQAMRNMSNADRFTVLWTDVQSVVGTETAGQVTDKSYLTIDHFRRCDLETHYNAGVAGTVADIQTGGLFLMMCSDEPSGTSAPIGSFTVRIRYTD